jgi:hypothetical protein
MPQLADVTVFPTMDNATPAVGNNAVPTTTAEFWDQRQDPTHQLRDLVKRGLVANSPFLVSKSKPSSQVSFVVAI